ncbi:LOW QUALITY PROTEIN: mediator of RNA polymerase II transcription subunit 15-like [Uloborus diversus]|uniref:LOW QUALITY PROTEIN: mediator of RNA polymerase II transcription subunit 15-like n=1 Tax=Uloborus diversus TaxID=327109 RepID=UPI002409B68C|nr:LOW QUALITY PROTEIN: mediator of RNA polymerase II transcription subunit 15-like [Uloborus diversus]
MDNMADAQEGSWRSQNFRQNVRGKIEEAIRQSGNPTTKSVAEMENHVFQKAKTKEEYLSFVARLIIHVREMNSKKAMTGPSTNMASAGGVGGQVASDPMSALRSMAGQGSGGSVTIQSQSGQTQMTASLLTASGGSISQMTTPPNPQPQIPVQNLGPGISSSSGPNVVTSSINPQGMSPMVMQQRFIGPGVLSSQQIQQRPQMLAPNVQMLPKFRQQGPPPNVTGGQMPMQGNYNENMFNMQSQPSPLSSQYQGHSPAPTSISNQGPNSNQSTIPSPAGHHPQSLGSQMAPSPVVYAQSPNSQIAPSPVGNYSVRTPGAPSPGSALNTPMAPGATPSPANRIIAEDPYLEKRKQLSKYIDPLKKMIARIDKDENKKKDLQRMKNLLEILNDPNRRCPMEVLSKCEQVLEKMIPSFIQVDGLLPPAQPVTAPMKTQEQNICQPLLDALANIKSPMFNHVLQKTFGPPITALFGHSIRVPTPPPKRRKVEDDSGEISDVLQGEIARLDQKFKVQLDPVQHFGSRTVNLICQLDDKNLPCVPSISITVPENYPAKPPQCHTTKDEYESTTILQSIQQVLSTRLSTMPQKYSITSLLDTWEMSVRQACASRPLAVEN